MFSTNRRLSSTQGYEIEYGRPAHLREEEGDNAGRNRDSGGHPECNEAATPDCEGARSELGFRCARKKNEARQNVLRS